MHYRNGRPANNGDKIVQLQMDSANPVGVGTLQNAVAGNDYCNGQIVVTDAGGYGPAIVMGACLCDCLHIDDLAAILKEKGLDRRPGGK